jgi:glycosyltransferase involved in cell wall biosynthesis
MPKINLLYVITKLELGGAQKQLLSLINALDKKKYNVFLLTAKEGYLVPEASAIKGLILKKSRFLERLINPLKDVFALFEIYCFIKRNKIQIVHTHSSKAGILGRLAARLAKAPVIVHTVHGWSFNEYQSAGIKYLYVLLERTCAAFTGKIIVVSRFDREAGLKRLIGRAGQYILIRYGLDARRFESAKDCNKSNRILGLSDTDSVVGMVACFKPQKAPLDFIELAALLKKDFPGTKFVLVGDGELRKKIELRIRQLNLEGQVILTGWRDDIALILSRLDVFVLTSLWEGLPIVVLEAMAAGVALAATDTGGIREIINNGKNGYLVAPQDLLSMRERLEELLNNPSKREEFARSSREVINTGEFLLNNMHKNTIQLYPYLLGESKNA